MNRNRLFEGLCALVLVALALPVLADEVPEFLRVDVAENGQPRALQVAVAEYRAADGSRLDLVGAVHVADAAYFHALNRAFDDYDVVLYELVGEMEARNESVLQMLFRAWLTGMATQTPEQAASAQAGLLRILLAEDRQLAMKRMFAEQLAGQQDLIDRMAGPESTLIVQRNLKALEVLERVRAEGHARIALFYGAGHFADFHQRLVGELGYEAAGVRWLDAWQLD